MLIAGDEFRPHMVKCRQFGDRPREGCPRFGAAEVANMRTKNNLLTRGNSYRVLLLSAERQT
jgi:hypothetical protein